jgi:site-specific DNA-methyltransferase (adenine-specific)
MEALLDNEMIGNERDVYDTCVYEQDVFDENLLNKKIKVNNQLQNSTVEYSNTDAVSYLSTIKNNSMDLVLTDPPYTISRKTGFESVVNGVQRFAVSMEFGDWDDGITFTIDDLAKIINEYYRVLRVGGTMIMFYDLWKIQELADICVEAGFKQLRLLEWVKTNPVPLNSKRNYLTNSREVAISVVKGGNPTFNSEYDNGSYYYPICHEKGRFHPTQKPLSLIRELIRKHSNKGDKVLDCFFGSGTTLVAAILEERKGCGCELNSSYYLKAIARMEELCPRMYQPQNSL